MTTDEGAQVRAQVKIGKLVAVIYVALIAILIISWSLHQIQGQLRMQPIAGQCGGVLVPVEGAPQGKVERCQLVSWRVPVLVATGFLLVLPAFLPIAALFVPLGRTRTMGVGRLRSSLFLLLVLGFAWLSLSTVIGIENNSQSEYCHYQRSGFAPWSNQGFPCWPEWGYLALHWTVFSLAAIIVVGLLALVVAMVLRRWHRG